MIVFVCAGNTCRSPMAEALAEARGLAADSAGTSVPASNHAAPLAVRALRDARGLALDAHTPKDVGTVDLEAAETVVAMDPGIAQQLRDAHDVAPERLVTWSIADPYGGRLADYRLCLEAIDTALQTLEE